MWIDETTDLVQAAISVVALVAIVSLVLDWLAGVVLRLLQQNKDM